MVSDGRLYQHKLHRPVRPQSKKTLLDARFFNAIKAARARGAKLIVLDPRVSDQAEDADLHLRLRAGTDAAMCLGWLKVIFDEGLYDKDFVDRWCAGFEALKARVDEYPLDRVEQITGVDRELIAQAARMYATADGAVIPWTPITDMQISSTSAIRLHSILRAVTGNIDIAGGETFGGFNASYISESEIALHEELAPRKKPNSSASTSTRPIPTAPLRC